MGKGRKHLYDGAGGHFSVMAELLSRGWNVAIPVVDAGDDIFVIKDKDRQFLPVQVKTANGKEYSKGSGYSAVFNVPISQLTTRTTPELVYVFVARFGGKWDSFITIGRFDLETLYNRGKFGAVYKDNLQITVSYRNGKIKCSGNDLTSYLNTWDKFPTILNP